MSRSRWQGCLLLGIWLAAVGLVAHFFFSQQSGLLSVALVAVWLLCGCAALYAWRAAPAGLLQWDGQCWHWLQDGVALTCNVRTAWDFQRWMLVQLTFAEGPILWLWLAPDHGRLPWNALRRALVHADAEFTVRSPEPDLEGQR